MPSIALGIDPDLHNTGWATVSMGAIIDAGVISVPARLRGLEAAAAMAAAIDQTCKTYWSTSIPDIAVVESMHYVDKRSRVRVQNILDLSLVAGAAGAALAAASWAPRWQYVSAVTWTKGIPKDVRHNRHRQLHFKMTDEDLCTVARCRPAQVIHVWDAAGLARWVTDASSSRS